jgi:hypothetical protein
VTDWLPPTTKRRFWLPAFLNTTLTAQRDERDRKMAPKRMREGKKVSKDDRAKKSGKVLARESFDRIKDFNAATMLDALRAAQLMVAPYMADSGLEIHLRGKVFYLSPEAAKPSALAAMFINIVDLSEVVFKHGDMEEQIEVAMAIGILSIPILHSCGTGKTLAEMIDTFLKDLEVRRRGGMVKTKWTPEVEQLARGIFATLKRGVKISNDKGIVNHCAHRTELAPPC